MSHGAGAQPVHPLLPRDANAPMKLPSVVATDAVVRSIELTQVQASHKAALDSRPLISQMPLQQAIAVTELHAQARQAVFAVAGVARYEAVSKL